jgi:hypothetical protein
MESERPHLELEKQTPWSQCSPLNYYLELAAFGECCANNPFNFGIQNSAGVPIIACPWVCGGHLSLSCELDLEIADDSTKHELSDQNGGAGYLPGIGIGHDRLDLSLDDHFAPRDHSTPRSEQDET